MAISVNIHEEEVDVESSAAGYTREVASVGDSKAVLSDGLFVEIHLKPQMVVRGPFR